jgi:NADPH-dependent 2,4-dienoyl-CoA reductase/sulfur reductase-like enzyme
VPDRYILPVATEDSAMDGLIEHFTKVEPTSVSVVSRRPRVVIIGAGFGGLATAMRLKRTDADVMVVDRRNHHLFQPLLYQVATAALSPADIAAPIPASSRARRTRAWCWERLAASMWRLAWF